MLWIKRDPQPGELSLSVGDDGLGLTSTELAAGNGLRNMQTRAASIGATLTTVALAPGHGITLWLPQRATAAPAS